MASVETLPLLLKQLNLSYMSQHWESVEQQAISEQWSYAEFLADLCEREADRRYQNRVARYTKESKLPPGKSLATFDFSAAEAVNKKQIEALSEDPSWVKQANNLVIFGPSGVGKTHLASAIAYRLIEHGVRALFATTTALVQKLQEARAKYQLPEALARLSRYELLVLDDIGYAKKDSDETSVLFDLIAERYETCSIIITANQPFSEWDKIFPDHMMAVAAIDRLIHHASIINVNALSYRKNQAEKKVSQETSMGGK